MSDLEAARASWLAERQQFDEFSKYLDQVLKREVQRAGILADVKHRTKELDSLIKKLIRKPTHSYESLPDKAGVRVVVRYKSEIDPVLEIANQVFDRSEPENKLDRLEPNTFGYLSVHADIRLKADDPLGTRYVPHKFHAELQVRTLAQHLWAEMAHDSVYASEDALRPVNKPLQRRIYILAGVVELADEEFNRIEREMPTVPEFRVLKSLERNYYKLTVRRGDPELSLEVIRLLLPLYGQNPVQVAARLNQVFSENEEMLHDVYSKAAEIPDLSAFLFQPEALMIYDLLKTEPLSVRESWTTNYPEKELERIANAFGISFD
jgi:ppGpp synthetase/RelA/SpoT-type nucleotidyltranferase